jgi:transposase-like protein
VVAEARRATIPLSQVAAKHGVTDAALRYQLYKAPRRASTKSDALALLPVRLSRAMAKQVEVELGASLRIRFEEGCDPADVAALVGRLL